MKKTNVEFFRKSNLDQLYLKKDKLEKFNIAFNWQNALLILLVSKWIKKQRIFC